MDRVESLISQLDKKDLDRKDLRVKEKALKELGSTGDRRAIPVLLNALGFNHPEDSECYLNMAAGISLANLGKKAIQPWIDALFKKDPSDSNDGWRRYWTARNMMLLEDERVIEPLVEALKDEDLRVVEGATNALVRLDSNIGLGLFKEKALEIMKKRYKEVQLKDIYITKLLKKTIKMWSKDFRSKDFRITRLLKKILKKEQRLTNNR